MKPPTNYTNTNPATTSLLDHAGVYGPMVSKYAGKVLQKCLEFTPDTAIARNLTLEILSLAQNELSDYESEQGFSTWLYTLSYNYCVETCILHRKNPFSHVSNS